MTSRIIGLYSPAPGSGKSTVAEFLEDYSYETAPFAGFLKGMIKHLLLDLGYSKAQASEMMKKKDCVVPGIDIRVRTLMQTLGTEWARNTLDQDFWIKCWKSKVESTRGFIVADDVRFLNEALAIKEMGGEVWQIIRPEIKNDEKHSSEGQLDHWTGFDQVIVNDSSIENFTAKVQKILDLNA